MIRFTPRKFALIVFLLAIGAFIYWKFFHLDLAGLVKKVKGEKYNVLLITIDTLRADRLGCYGYSEIQTPNIDALAKSGVLFKDATAHVPLTLPAHTSIMTGNFPPYHGVHDNGGFYVSKSQTTMAELFKQNGFSTAAFVGAYVLDSMWGIDQGFDTYFDNFDVNKAERVSLGEVQRGADEVYTNSIQWLDGHRKEKFFLWVHFYDPHTPYEPPKQYADLYRNRPYVGEIAYTDSVVGKLLNYFDQHKLRDKTIILLTGDHGESLGEHKEATHAFFIYDATLHVPMILSVPGRTLREKRVLQQARSVDIAPTLLQLSGIGVPESVQGRSLLHLILDSPGFVAPSFAECRFPEYHFGWSRLLSLRDGNYKYIDAPEPELYDLNKDPKELTNIYKDKKEIAERMRVQLNKIDNVKTEGSTMQPGAIDNETHEKLAALGYVGAFETPSNTDPSKLGDPKKKIDLFNTMTAARMDSLDGKSDEAIAKFQRIVTIDPGIVDAHFMLGNEYFRASRYEEAKAAFKKALELKPDYEFAMINLANTYRKMGQPDAALAGYEYFLEKNPKNTHILAQIGEIYLTKKDPDKAMSYLRRALDVDPETSWVYNSIGVAYLQKKQQKDAEDSFLKALQLNPKINMAHFNLAQLYESQGKTEQAEKEYLTELEISDKNFKAAFNLGRMYISQGRLNDGIRYLTQVTQNAPEFGLGYLYLAQAYVELGSDLDKAMQLAQTGLSKELDPEYRPLGHYVLADIYNRMGKFDLERRELSLAKKIK
jgi:arylsulfatase A-like enzyme/Tfp pilus assembly protein PilF